MTKIDDRYWIETDSFVHSQTQQKSSSFDGIKGTSFPYIRAPHTVTPHNPSLSRFEIFPNAHTLNLNLYIPLNILTFLLLILKDLTCIQDNQIPLL